MNSWSADLLPVKTRLVYRMYDMRYGKKGFEIYTDQACFDFIKYMSKCGS